MVVVRTLGHTLGSSNRGQKRRYALRGLHGRATIISRATINIATINRTTIKRTTRGSRGSRGSTVSVGFGEKESVARVIYCQYFSFS